MQWIGSINDPLYDDSLIDDDGSTMTWDDDLDVSARAAKLAFRGRKSRRTTPGPDGISATVWKQVDKCTYEWIVTLFTEYLRRGIFLSLWKIAHLVLIPKGPVNFDVMKFRPICLLDDIGKALERVIEERIREHLSSLPNGGLSPFQYGFRRGRSTVDKLIEIKGFVTKR